jgi:cytochrome c biogenesis protein CcmG/thiol:disulfide interchange protein DsbE
LKSLRFLIPIALFGVLVWFLFRGLSLNPREVPSPLIGKPAPAFTLPRLDDPDKAMRREDFAGKPWVMNVWASWCAPCREEHYKDRPGDARAWLERLGNPYAATLIDFDGKVGIDFGVYGVPETFVIDAQGVVRYKHVGPLTRKVLQDKIEPLLKQLGA